MILRWQWLQTAHPQGPSVGDGICRQSALGAVDLSLQAPQQAKVGGAEPESLGP